VNMSSDQESTASTMREVGGSRSRAFNNVLANQAIQSLWLPPGLPETERDRRYQAAVGAMVEFKPADGIEGMMAAQAVGLHTAAMECLRRAMISEQPSEACSQLHRQGANLSRAFLDVVAALDRKRGKGAKQVVRVERVMVAPGGQAIVGNVQAGAGRARHDREGVGYDGETRGEPHATAARLAHDATSGAVLPPLRGADPGRDTLPIASDAERSLPNARRGKHRA